MAAALALSAAVCWGCADFLAGLQSRRLAAVFVALGAQAVGLPIVAVATALEGEAAPPIDIALLALGMGVVNAFAFYGVCVSLAMGVMARVAPVFALSSIIPVAFGLATGDDPSAFQVLGMVMAFTGVVLVSLDTGDGDDRPSATRNRRAMVVACLTAATIGVYLVGLDHVAGYSPNWASTFVRSAAIATLVVIAVAIRADRPPAAPAYVAPIAGVGVLDAGANLLWAAASTAGLLSLIATLGAVFPVVTVFLGIVILHERLARYQAFGVVATLAGCALITSG